MEVGEGVVDQRCSCLKCVAVAPMLGTNRPEQPDLGHVSVGAVKARDLTERAEQWHEAAQADHRA